MRTLGAVLFVAVIVVLTAYVVGPVLPASGPPQ